MGAKRTHSVVYSNCMGFALKSRCCIMDHTVVASAISMYFSFERTGNTYTVYEGADLESPANCIVLTLFKALCTLFEAKYLLWE